MKGWHERKWTLMSDKRFYVRYLLKIKWLIEWAKRINTNFDVFKRHLIIILFYESVFVIL